MIRKLTVILIAVFTVNSGLFSQSIEDALKFSTSNGTITPRVAGLGVAYHGLADDIGALMFNPAGIGIINKSELSMGMGFTRNSSETEYINLYNTLNTNDEYITHLGLISPFKTGKSSAAIGIGYFLENNYDNYMDYSGFNYKDSYIGNYVKNTGNEGNENKMDILGLAGNINGAFTTPLDSMLGQDAQITESGGLHNITGAVAWNVSENVAIGLSITGKWGSYHYDKQYVESDTKDYYTVNDNTNWTDVDFDRMELQQTLDQDISGITGAIGVIGRFEDIMRFGATIKFPTYYEISEQFSENYNVYFDNGEDSYYNSNGETSYKVSTPFIYCAGVSFHAKGLVFSAGVEYADVSQTEFSDATDDIGDLNSQIIREYVGQTTWGFGVEYTVPILPVQVRSSFSSTTSPYTQDISGASVKRFSIGGGVFLSNNVRLDGVFRWTSHSEQRINYLSGGDSGSYYILNEAPTNIGFQITYRY